MSELQFHGPTKADIDRFWSKVEKRGPDDCWEWQAGKRGGYGSFYFNGTSAFAHRFSYQLEKGAIGHHECVCHTCDNPPCVNPNHLWLGTRAENNADKMAKGRGRATDKHGGEGNPNCTISAAEVVTILVMTKAGFPQSRLANYLGVSPASVNLITKGKQRANETPERVSAALNACQGIDDPSVIPELVEVLADMLAQSDPYVVHKVGLGEARDRASDVLERVRSQ